MDSPDPTTTINKIYPSVDELSCINRSVACTEPGCTSIFKSTSNLTLHLAKTHRKADLLVKQSSTAAATINEYHCPVAACTYSKGSAAAFKRLKLLKQHYLKVHCARAYACTALCGQSFATESYRDKHSEYCHVSFRCCDCANFYASYDTLRTHSRRKRHKILNKIDYKITPLLMLNKITQTMLPPQQQQVVTAAQTQTVGENEIVEGVLSGGEHNNATSQIRKSIKTQTTVIPSRSTSCNTSFNLNDFEFTIDDNDDLQRKQSSISTQTHRNLNNNNQGLLLPPPTITPPPPPQIVNDLDDDDSSFFNNISVATSSSSSNNNTTSRTTNCCASNNTESQTDGNLLLFDDNYCDYYTNMYTQTCDDMLLNEIGFHNIETQTMFDDVLRSVESQTVMSLHHYSGGGNTAMRISNNSSLMPSSPMLCSISSISNGKDTNHMETQTDLEFKQMLEEINA